MLEIQHDGKDQPYIQWEQSPGICKRAWVQQRDPGEDWAGTPEGRYLDVVRCNESGNPSGNATDFPIFWKKEQMSDEQILIAFVTSACAITGCKIR